MISQENNYAFIDSQNLNLNIKLQGWILDFKKFRIYLKEKYAVQKAYIFIGYMESNKDLYYFLKRAGYICIFKPTLEYNDGHTKGNCDAELVLQTMIEIEKFDEAIIVSGDGDFYCLIKHLISKQKLKNVLVPNNQKYSALLRSQETRSYLQFMNSLEKTLGYRKEKSP